MKTSIGHQIQLGTLDQSITELTSQKHRLHSWLDAWCESFTNFLSTLSTDYASQSQNKAISSTLITHHASTTIILSTRFSQHESAYDAHLPLFECIIHHAETALTLSVDENGQKPPFTFEMGLGMPLTLVAFKCRHLHVRQRALALLRKVTAVQGLWRRDTKLKAIQRVIELEEDEAIGQNPQSSYLTSEEDHQLSKDEVQIVDFVTSAGKDSKWNIYLSLQYFASVIQSVGGLLSKIAFD